MTFITRHRAVWGILGAIACPCLLLRQTGGIFQSVPGGIIDGVLSLLFVTGMYALQSSPYWHVVFRESPLRREIEGRTDLDERESALRDRANRLTYVLAITILMLFIGALQLVVNMGWYATEGSGLARLILPIGFIFIPLPILVLEWFEPSGDPTRDDD